MNTSRFSTLTALSHKRIVARALILALSLVGTPLLAGQTVDAKGPAHGASQRQSVPSSRGDDKHDESGSRINGRADWDVDYPSQLAPPELKSPRDTDAVATLAAPACSAADECAP
ncbi:hypothetical protein [Dyella humicola]|uniref:hypothetical protein n=1 Tax=Dyella humicola TaxID=2992126 RepID=UPI002257929B|nr:hypothetical protein [Dyella humicola]